MPVLIDEVTAEIAAPAPAGQSAPAHAAPSAPEGDLLQAIALLQERRDRLKID
jgi:hypothetical protein